MQIFWTREKCEELIKKYYLENRNCDINVSIVSEVKTCWYNNTPVCVTTISVTDEATLFGNKITATETINKNDLNNICRYFLEREGYILDDFEYDEEVKREIVGCFMNEAVSEAYFNGLILNIREKNLENSLVKKL